MIREITAKGKEVGKFCDDGVYRKWVNGGQIFKIKGNSVGIMENTIQQLNAEPTWTSIEVVVRDGEFVGKYTMGKEDVMAPMIRTENCGWGVQRFLPLWRMKKNGPNNSPASTSS